MIEEKLYKNSDISSLLKDVLIITLIASILLLLIGRFGGTISDKITKSSCNAINETYIKGAKPGEGVCIKSSGNIDIKK